MEIEIKKTALDFILKASRRIYPNEFTALLRGGGNVIEEVLLIPGTLFGENFATIRLDMKPIDSTIIGSVHSHPSKSYKPSDADLRFFSKFGYLHLVVKYPYKSIQDIAVYDLAGNRIGVKVLE